ncbi:hypothetical protein U1Q18_051452 [Sarracenia purpurea var. burkii]
MPATPFCKPRSTPRAGNVFQELDMYKSSDGPQFLLPSQLKRLMVLSRGSASVCVPRRLDTLLYERLSCITTLETRFAGRYYTYAISPSWSCVMAALSSCSMPIMSPLSVTTRNRSTSKCRSWSRLIDVK